MTKKPSEIFELAKKYNLYSSKLNPLNISNDNYLQFIEEYRFHSKARDRNLSDYLVSTPKLFRTFIPYNRKLLEILSEVVWYYDEIIIPDLIYVKTISENNSEREIEEDKVYVYHIIQFLKKFEESIKEGFILLSGERAFPVLNKEVEKNKDFLELVKDEKVLRELEKLVDIYVQRLNGKEITSVIAQHRNLKTLKFIPNKEVGATIMFDREFELGTIELLEKLNIRDIIEGEIRNSFIYDIGEIIANLSISNHFGSHTMYGRRIDEITLKKLNQKIVGNKQDYNDLAYKVILPFVKNIPSERLVDLRMKMPIIFEDFRYYMSELVIELKEKFGNDDEMIGHKLKGEINKQLLKFEKEQKIALRKTKIIGIGSPLMTLAGAFSIQKLGVDISNIIAPSSVAVLSLTELNTLFNYLKQKDEAKTNSLYYLWKASK